MTEEIINGIDVSECNYFNKVVNEEPYCNIDEEHLYTCSSDENCYYKQLKRLEQENNAYKQSEQEAIEIIAELKEKVKELDKMTGIFSARLCNKYRSTLEEIREIADKCKECLNEDDDCGCDYLRIKRRIDEVLR